MQISNSQGKIWYGMHFYPGLAEYQEKGKDPYRVYLNEDTIRKMDATFAGRPIFVDHVDSVEENVDELRKEADGWVIESFFNAADGKHWVKFITTSKIAERAIQGGMRLSNAYVPKSFASGGLWNGIEYTKEITSGEYEHLAIVNNPRYEESVIMTPEAFKRYNETKIEDIKRISNSKGESKMKLNLFKRSKVENSTDFEGMLVILPKSGVEKTITALVNEADEMEDAKKKNEIMAMPEHKVKMHDGSMCNVGELVAKHKALCDEMADLKKPKEDSIEKEEGMDSSEKPVEVEGDMANEDDDKKKEEESKKNEEKEIEEEKKKNEADKKAKAKEKADALRNAHLNQFEEDVATVELMQDQVVRGKARYGS